jgi:hypothetical protein
MSAVFTIASLTSCQDAVGLYEKSNPASPETKGAAMDVPDISEYSGPT